jgi:hypothetical protein
VESNITVFSNGQSVVAAYIDPNNKPTIDDWFQQMYDNGQRRARLVLWHMRLDKLQDYNGIYLNSCYNADPPYCGSFSPAVQTSINQILQKLKDIGFVEVHVTMGPGGYNLPLPCEVKVSDSQDPNSWCSADDPHENLWQGSIESGTGNTDPWHQWTDGVPPGERYKTSDTDYMGENWNIIWNTWHEIRAFHDGVTFIVKMDFGGEILPVESIYNDGIGAPAPAGRTGFAPGHQGESLYHRYAGKAANYVFTMWWNFNYVFGKTDVNGFALNGPDHVASAFEIYGRTGYGNPYLWSLYAYDNAGQVLLDTDAKLMAKGDTQTGIVIAEAYFNDANSAASLNSATQSISRPVFFLTQWSSDAAGVTYYPPAAYTNYLAYNF